MKKAILTIIAILVSFSNLVYAQSGYRDYLFGTDISVITDSLKKTFPETRELSTNSNDEEYLSFIMKHLYSSQFSNIVINPLPLIINYKTVTNNTRANDNLAFRFANNKLFAVMTYILEGSVFDALKERYGSGISYTIQTLDRRYDTLTDNNAQLWIDGSDRYILYEKFSPEAFFNERITYIDKNWADRFCKEVFEAYQKMLQERDQSNRAIID